MKKAAVRTLSFILIVISIFNIGALAATGPEGYKQYTPEEYYEKLEYIADIITQVCYYSDADADPIRLGIKFMAEVSPELYPSLKNAGGMSGEQLKSAVIAVLQKPEDFYTLANYLLAYDRYMIYVEPDDYDRVYDVPTTFVGIGVQVENTDGDNRVSVVYQHSPAKDAGLRAGDVIVEVDGQNVSGMSLDELVGFLKGPEGSSVTMGVKRQGTEEILRFTMKRTAVVVDTAIGEYLGDGVYLLTILKFNGLDTIIETNAALNEAKNLGAKSIIVDLRGNPGGDMDALLNVMNMFIKKADVTMLTEEYRDGSRSYSSTGSSFDFSKVVILINEYSASASEVMAGSLQGLGIARVVGQKSYGKGMAQYHIELDNNDYAVVTISRLILPVVGSYDLKGINPDYKVENKIVPYPMPQMAGMDGKAPLYVGSSGERVLALEQRLSALGYFTGTPDKTFDSASLEALNTMRKRAGLGPTAICGVISLTELERQITELSSREIVEDLQMEKAIELAEAS